MFNFEMDSRDLAVDLLVGLPHLTLALNQSAHESLCQRIVMNYHMGGISKENDCIYLLKKLEAAGCRQAAFDDNTLRFLLNASNGTAHVINRICNLSLMIAASIGQGMIASETVMKPVNDTRLG